MRTGTYFPSAVIDNENDGPAAGEARLRVQERMGRGDTFASVEEQLIDASSFSEPEKAALWLFGWSFVNWRRQRGEAVRHIERLDGDANREDAARPRLGLADVSPAR